MTRTHRPPNRLKRPAALGFSIVELLIAVMIISILSLILVPNLSNRAEQAREAACRSDLERIGDAQARVATDIGYYLRLFALDDIAHGDGVGLGVGDVFDGIGDESFNTLFGNPGQVFIDLRDHTLLNSAQADNVFNNVLKLRGLGAGQTSYSPTWYGPYYSIQEDQTAAEHNLPPLTDNLHLHDIPNDPWGNDYLFLVRGGVLIEPEGVLRSTFNGSDASRFDRPTFLSLGPNMLPGDGTPNSPLGEGDDIFRSVEF